MKAPALAAYVVEDNAALRESLIETLHELTCMRVIGSSGEAAQAQAWLTRRPNDWQLLLVDLLLRDGNGLQLIGQMGPRQATQKVVVLSNYASAAVRKRCAQLGVDAVFDKSTEMDALVDYCSRLCARAGA